MPRKPPPPVEQPPQSADTPTPAVPSDGSDLAEPARSFDEAKARQKAANKAKRKAKFVARLAEAEERAAETTADWPPIPDKRASTETRVRFIIDLMADGRWELYLSRAPLAKAWGVSDSRIKQYSAEAFRRLQCDDPQEIAQRRLSLSRWVARLRDRAASLPNDVTGLPEWADCLKAVELEARLLGIEIDNKRRIELTGKDGESLGLAELFGRLDEKQPAPQAPADPDASPKPKRTRKPKA